MLVEVKDKVVSTEIFKRKFVCDLNACKGACCVEGDAGAPLKKEEVSIIEENLEMIKPYMRQEGIEAVKSEGVSYLDQENEPVTTLINGGECAFVFFDEKGITKCSIEQAYLDGKINYKKPISCHLYPIRVKKFNDFEALAYDEWDICKPACACGDALDVPVYKFLKEPLIRAYGPGFFDELLIVDEEFQKSYNK
jgi:hypothetical protein